MNDQDLKKVAQISQLLLKEEIKPIRDLLARQMGDSVAVRCLAEQALATVFAGKPEELMQFMERVLGQIDDRAIPQASAGAEINVLARSWVEDVTHSTKSRILNS